MQPYSRSAITSTQTISPTLLDRQNMKTSSIVSTEESIYSSFETDRVRRMEKNSLLKQTIEEQLRKMKLVCQSVKQQVGNQKTPDIAKVSASYPAHQLPTDKPKTHQNSEAFRLLIGSPEKGQPLATPTSANNKPTSTNKLQSLLKKPSLVVTEQDPLLNLQEVREIESFMDGSDDELDESIVEEHGAAVLDWGVCMGKASEFKILKFLDQGQYGKVYLAQSHRNKVIYSIKSIYRTTMDSTTLNQLMREVKIQAFLDHPHIVKLYHFFVDQDSAYLVMEPCLGRNLYQNLKEVGKMNETLVRELIRQVCTAVEYMHKNNILHRDIKPENILLHENLIKICDFGWAVHSPLMRGTQCGTPLYTPPEIVSKVPYDSKIDIWSIGILTYQLLYGNIPFEIRHLDDMTKIIEQQVYFSQAIQISEAAKDFIMNCLNKNPIERYTIRQLLQHEFIRKTDKYRWTIV